MATQPIASQPKVSAISNMATRYSMERDKLLEVLRGTVIKPDKHGNKATNEEIAAFCIVADQYNLNPFVREIYAFAAGDKGIVPIVGIDGWVKIVNSTGRFDGCEFEDTADDTGLPAQITCRMFVKDRSHPICATERYSECKRNTIPWNTMPWRMLRHKAYMQAARYAFGLAGIYDDDEARDIVNNAVVREPVPMPRALGEPEKSQAPPTAAVEGPHPADKLSPESLAWMLVTRNGDGGDQYQTADAVDAAADVLEKYAQMYYQRPLARLSQDGLRQIAQKIESGEITMAAEATA